MAKQVKYKHPANLERHQAICDQFSSNKAGTHDNRPKRQRTRANAKKNAIKHGSW